MATKYECDRCSKQSTTRTGIGTVTYPLLDYSKRIQEDVAVKKDLCNACIYELHEFLKPISEISKG